MRQILDNQLLDFGWEADVGRFIAGQAGKVPEILNAEELGQIAIALTEIRKLILAATQSVGQRAETMEEAQAQTDTGEVIRTLCEGIAKTINDLPIRDQATKTEILELTLRSIFNIIQSITREIERVQRASIAAAMAAKLPGREHRRRGRPRKVRES